MVVRNHEHDVIETDLQRQGNDETLIEQSILGNVRKV
jgi:hypothetical protein